MSANLCAKGAGFFGLLSKLLVHELISSSRNAMMSMIGDLKIGDAVLGGSQLNVVSRF